MAIASISSIFSIFSIAILLFSLFSTACSTPVSATIVDGPWQLSGTVFAMDGSVVGGPVSGAQLTMIRGEEVRASTTTDAVGHYAFTGLETGSFKLTISAPGFVRLTPLVNLDRDIKADFAIKRK